jgi:Ca-activated chloride channel family protein
LLNILEHVEPPTVRDTGTNIGDALAEGVIRLDRVNAKRKVIVLLSDGEHNIDLRDEARQPLKPRQAASLAAHLDIPIYTIDTGGDPKDADSMENRLAGMEINRQVAEMTGGRSFSASDGQQLLEVCKTIDAMERQPIVGFVYRRYHEYYGWLALAACGFAALAFLLEQTIWRRIP